MRIARRTSTGTRGRTAGAAFFGLVTASTMALGVAAFACTPSNTVTLSNQSGAVGERVTANGSSVVPHREVIVRWNGADGPVLATVMPADGTVSANFVVPDASPGYYTVLATQSDDRGNQLLGRASFQVVGPAGQGAPAQPAAFSTPAPADPSSGAPLVLALALGAGGLGLMGAGAAVAVGHARRRQVAAVAATSSRTD